MVATLPLLAALELLELLELVHCKRCWAGRGMRIARSGPCSVVAASGWRLLSLVLPTCIVFNAAKQVPKCAVDQRRRQGSVVRLAEAARPSVCRPVYGAVRLLGGFLLYRMLGDVMDRQDRQGSAADRLAGRGGRWQQGTMPSAHGCIDSSIHHCLFGSRHGRRPWAAPGAGTSLARRRVDEVAGGERGVSDHPSLTDSSGPCSHLAAPRPFAAVRQSAMQALRMAEPFANASTCRP